MYAPSPRSTFLGVAVPREVVAHQRRQQPLRSRGVVERDRVYNVAFVAAVGRTPFDRA